MKKFLRKFFKFKNVYRIKYFEKGLPVERYFKINESGVGGLIFKLGVSGAVCEKIKIEETKKC